LVTRVAQKAPGLSDPTGLGRAVSLVHCECNQLQVLFSAVTTAEEVYF